VPVPVASASSGLAGSLLATTRVLLSKPTAVGSKVTMMVQLALAASAPPATGQVPPVMEKAVVTVR
jgi:hypothetical protein